MDACLLAIVGKGQSSKGQEAQMGQSVQGMCGQRKWLIFPVQAVMPVSRTEETTRMDSYMIYYLLGLGQRHPVGEQDA